MADKKTKTVFQKFLKDPLFHFLILGTMLAVFAHYWIPSENENNKYIFISKLNQKHLANLFEITWQRPPTHDELGNLIDEHIKEEIYYREALELGLDDNDTIVRRRMRQKLEFMNEDISSNSQPTEENLKNYYNLNKDNYFTNRIISVDQILVSSKRLSGASPEFILARKKIENGADPKSLSQSTLLPMSLKLETEKTITSTFGANFLNQLSMLEHEHWVGPVYSAFGTHMVNVQLDQSALPLEYSFARDKVKSDYLQSQRELFADNYYTSMKSQYQIVIEKP